MSRTLRTITRRGLRRTPGRFIALFLIVFLGAGFLAGLQSAAPGMVSTADDYYARTELPDFRLICNLGITDEDIAAAGALPGVAQAYGGHRVDLKASIGEAVGAYAVYALPEDAPSDTRPSPLTLTEGSLPKNVNECVADAYSLIRPGDVIRIAEDNATDSLERFAPRRLTVVGLALSSAYVSTTRGNTTIGSGQISNFLYVPEAAFTGDYYTELSVRFTGTEGLSAFSRDYETAIEAGRASLEEFTQLRAGQRHARITDEAKTELDEAEDEYASESERVDSELASAKSDLETGRIDLDEGRERYAKYTNELIEAHQELDRGRVELATSRQTLDTQKSTLTAARATVAEGRTTLDWLRGQRDVLAAAQAAESDPITIASLQAQMGALQAQIDAAAEQVTVGEQQIAAGEQELTAGEAAWATAETELQAAEQELAANKASLESFYDELTRSTETLDEGREEYDERSAEARDELRRVRAELDANWDTWETLEPPVWTIESREDFPGYAGFIADKDRIANLALILPWFFFLIAAIVCLTTMTRLVEEHRIQIGTLKASGYYRGQITGIYQSYAWLIGLSGGTLGVVCGVLIFPPVIWNAYSTMYYMGAFKPAIALLPCLIGLFGGAIAISVATAIACRTTLERDAAELMRPRAPRAGRHILLERARGLWRRLPFCYKVTARNLARYKLRFAVTVLGVAGCTALLVAGFGLRDSLSSVASLHYGDISHSRATIILDKPSSATTDTALNDSLAITELEHAYAHVESVSVSFDGRTDSDTVTYLFVPEDPVAFNDFVTFRARRGNERLAFPPATAMSAGVGAVAGAADVTTDGGAAGAGVATAGGPSAAGGPTALITEQLADRLGAKAGDLVTFGATDGPRVQIRIAGITENYVYNYLYLTPATYRTLLGTAPQYSSVYLISDLPNERFDPLLSGLVATDNVATALSVGQLEQIMEQVVANMNSVVALMILAALILAIVVLYNLITIAITERERELATMKVLGYRRREVAAFLSRETTAMSVVGLLFGLVLGIVLHGMVMGTIEVNEIMFPRIILPQSFAFAILFPLLCNLLVNLSARPRLNRLDPVTSLKSVE
jgi:putative ABC transport system permease protein